MRVSQAIVDRRYCRSDINVTCIDVVQHTIYIRTYYGGESTVARALEQTVARVSAFKKIYERN
jgi:hypothetical protein